jgi:hypothetical protein
MTALSRHAICWRNEVTLQKMKTLLCMYIYTYTSIEVGSWNANMVVFGIDKAQADKMRGKHRLLAEHDFVLQSYWEQRLQGVMKS